MKIFDQERTVYFQNIIELKSLKKWAFILGGSNIGVKLSFF